MAYHKNATYRLERLVKLLQQANEALIGCGQYIAESDPNRQVVTEIIRMNHVVIQEENRALSRENAPSIITMPEPYV